MLEISLIRNKPEEVKQRLTVKNFKELNLVDGVFSADEKRRGIQTKLDENLAKQNAIAKEIGELFKNGKREDAEKKKSETVQLKEESKLLEADLIKTEEEVNHLMTTLPFYPLRKSLEVLPLIKDAEIS